MINFTQKNDNYISVPVTIKLINQKQIEMDSYCVPWDGQKTVTPHPAWLTIFLIEQMPTDKDPIRLNAKNQSKYQYTYKYKIVQMRQNMLNEPDFLLL